MTVYNVDKLLSQLIAGGISCSGCNSNGVVWDVNGTTEIQTRSDVATIIASYTNQPTLSDYNNALQVFLDQTAIDRGYTSEQNCLNGASSTDPNYQADAATMQTYDLYCHVTLNGVFGYTGNTRLPGEKQLNPPPHPSIDEFLNSTLNSISW
jgi:hypothetical protein